MSEELASVLVEGLTPRQQAVLDGLRGGNTRSASYRSAEISKTTFYRWMGESGTFRDSVERAEADAEAYHVAIIRRCSEGGALKSRKVRHLQDGTVVVDEEFTEPDWKPSAWWLERRRREWLAERAIDPEQLSDGQLLALLEDEDQKGGSSAEAPLEEVTGAIGAAELAEPGGAGGIVS